jgi:repressor LexA
MRPLTKIQARILDVITTSIDERGFPPTIREICKAIEMHSTSTVAYQLQALEARGYIRRFDGTARGIKIIERKPL